MPNSFPDIHTTGAVHHWVQARWMSEPYYLGTAEISPQVIMRQYYSEVMAPAAGGVLPFQREYEGQAATVSVLFTRWSKLAEFGLMVNGANTVYSTQFTQASGGSSGVLGGGNYGLPGTLVTIPSADYGSGGDFGSDGLSNVPPPPVVYGPGDYFTPPDLNAAGFGQGYGTTIEPPSGLGDPANPGSASGPGGNTGSFFSFDFSSSSTQSESPKKLSLFKQGAEVGAETRWSRGSLAFGNRDFRLWQVFDFAGWGRVASKGLENGRYWPQVTLERHGIISAGTQGKRMLLVFDCQPQFNSEGTPGGIPAPGTNERGWVLWRLDPAAFPSSVLVPQ